jgi:hypothetical protein
MKGSPQLSSFWAKSQVLEIHMWKAFQCVSGQGVLQGENFSQDLL